MSCLHSRCLIATRKKSPQWLKVRDERFLPQVGCVITPWCLTLVSQFSVQFRSECSYKRRHADVFMRHEHWSENCHFFRWSVPSPSLVGDAGAGWCPTAQDCCSCYRQLHTREGCWRYMRNKYLLQLVCSFRYRLIFVEIILNYFAHIMIVWLLGSIIKTELNTTVKWFSVPLCDHRPSSIFIWWTVVDCCTDWKQSPHKHKLLLHTISPGRHRIP